MKLDMKLEPLHTAVADRDGEVARVLTVNWDSATGQLSGPDAAAVARRVKAYAGKSYGVPHRMPPESILVADPLHRPEEMAVLLGEVWKLPPELEALYPKVESLIADNRVY